MKKFSNNFWWGAALSATQSEGASNLYEKGENIWDYWYKTNPEKFFNKIGPTNTSDFYHKYKEDIALMKEAGFNTARTSISWSRLIPDGEGEVNKEAVKFYKNLIKEFKDNGIEPFICLYHFDMPMKLQEKYGGFESKHTVNAFKEYSKKCFELFGDQVKYWFTHNEPIVTVLGGYLYGWHYPAIHDFKKAIQVGYNQILSNAIAVNEYRKIKNEKNFGGKIGIIFNLSQVYPRSNSPEDIEAAKIADLFENKSFLDPVIKGKFPKELISLLKKHDLMPEYTNQELKIIKNNIIDILGFNYYAPKRVKAKENGIDNKVTSPESFYETYKWPEAKMNIYRGWEIYAKGVYDRLINLKEEYGNIPVYISENGMGVENEERFITDGEVNDAYRIEFIKEHLDFIHKALDEGVNIKGYHLWTFADNWSWLNAYKNRYGLLRVDIDNNFKRSKKKSFYFFKELRKNNGY